MTVILAGQPDGGRIHNGRHLSDVFRHQAEKEGFIAIVQGSEIDVAFQIAVLALVIFIGALQLIFHPGHVGW